jgi:hypothetical protein
MTESTVTYITGSDPNAGAVPAGTDIATHLRADGKTIQDVYGEMDAFAACDTILITYQDATKAVITKVEYKLLGVVIKTLTPTYDATTDTWVRS